MKTPEFKELINLAETYGWDIEDRKYSSFIARRGHVLSVGHYLKEYLAVDKAGNSNHIIEEWENLVKSPHDIIESGEDKDFIIHKLTNNIH